MIGIKQTISRQEKNRDTEKGSYTAPPESLRRVPSCWGIYQKPRSSGRSSTCYRYAWLYCDERLHPCHHHWKKSPGNEDRFPDFAVHLPPPNLVPVGIELDRDHVVPHLVRSGERSVCRSAQDHRTVFGRDGRIDGIPMLGSILHKVQKTMQILRQIVKHVVSPAGSFAQPLPFSGA